MEQKNIDLHVIRGKKTREKAEDGPSITSRINNYGYGKT
jgi:hypothetical protein